MPEWTIDLELRAAGNPAGSLTPPSCTPQNHSAPLITRCLNLPQVTSQCNVARDWVRYAPFCFCCACRGRKWGPQHHRFITGPPTPPTKRHNGGLLSYIARWYKSSGLTMEVWLDSSLKFTCHISKMSSKISSAIGVISRVSRYLPVVQRKMLYNAMVLPYFNYCSITWATADQKHLDVLERLQKRAGRMVLGVPSRTSTRACQNTFVTISPEVIINIALGRLLLVVYIFQH